MVGMVMAHPLDPIVQALSGAEAGLSRTQHLRALRKRLEAEGIVRRFGPPPSHSGMEKWFERETLPTKWLLCLRTLADADGKAIEFPQPVVRKGTTDGHPDAAGAAAA